MQEAIEDEYAESSPESVSPLSIEARGGSTLVVPGEAYAVSTNKSTLMHDFTFIVPFNNEAGIPARITAPRSSNLLMLKDAHGRTRILKTAKYGDDLEVYVVLPAGSYMVSALTISFMEPFIMRQWLAAMPLLWTSTIGP